MKHQSRTRPKNTRRGHETRHQIGSHTGHKTRTFDDQTETHDKKTRQEPNRDTTRGHRSITQDKDTRRGHSTRTPHKETTQEHETRINDEDTKQGHQRKTRTPNKDT